MANFEFLYLKDVKTGEAIYLHVQSIEIIRQLCEDENYPRSTVIHTKKGEVCRVTEEARDIALAIGL